MRNKAGYWFDPEEPADVARELHRKDVEPTDNRRFKKDGLKPPVTVIMGTTAHSARIASTIGEIFAGPKEKVGFDPTDVSSIPPW